MAFYNSQRETYVSKKEAVGQPQIYKSGHDEDDPGRRGVLEMLTSGKHRTEKANFETLSSKVGQENFKSVQRKPGFQIKKSEITVPEQSASVSSTKLNPKAKPFVSKPIQWDKLPLRQRESSLSLSSLSLDSYSYDASILSFTDDVTIFGSSEGTFSRPNQAVAPVQKKTCVLQAFHRRGNQQKSSVDQCIFQDTCFDESPDMTLDDVSSPRKSTPYYSDKKCYHCGCIGHMAVECYSRKQGFDAVCFECRGTGHKAAECPVKFKTTEATIVEETDSMILQTPDLPRRNKPLCYSSSMQREEMNNGRSWSNNSKGGKRRMQKNKRFFLLPKNKSKRTKNVGSQQQDSKHSKHQWSKMKSSDCSSNVESGSRYMSETSNNSPMQVRMENNLDSRMGLTNEEMSYRNKEASKFVLINDTNHRMVLKEVNELHQTSYFKEALAKVLLMTFQTEAIRATLEMSYGSYLAEDVYFHSRIPSYHSTMIPELPVNVLNRKVRLPTSTYMDRVNCSRNRHTHVDKCVLFEKGVRVGPFELQLLLKSGIKEVKVQRKPKIVVLSFGRDLINWDSSDIKLDSIIDINGPVLEAMVEECGCEILARELLQDGFGLTNEIGGLLENCDVLLVNGDVSLVITELKGSIGSVKCIRMNSGEKVFFFTLMDRKSGIDKIVFGLPRSLNSAVVAFHLLIKPSLKKMMGALTTVKKTNVPLGESFCLDGDTGDFRPVYSDDNKKGNILTKCTQSSHFNKASSLIRAQELAYLPNISNLYNHVPIGQLNSTEFIPSICESSYQNMKRNLLQKSFSVGIISLGDSAKKHMSAITPMINQLLSREVIWTFENHSINDPQLLSTLMDWTLGNRAKHFIFTFGGLAHTEDMHVLKTTQSLVNPELPLLFEKMIDGLSVGVKNVCFYRGTIGICRKSLIVNLPGKLVAVKHCLQELQDYVETIIDALEE